MHQGSMRVAVRIFPKRSSLVFSFFPPSPFRFKPRHRIGRLIFPRPRWSHSESLLHRDLTTSSIMYFPSLESHWLDLINKKRFEKGLRWIHHFSLTTICHLFESFKKRWKKKMKKKMKERNKEWKNDYQRQIRKKYMFTDLRLYFPRVSDRSSGTYISIPSA